MNVSVGGFGALADLDLYIYRRNADGTRGDYVTGDGQILGAAENAAIEKATGAYWVVVTPYTTIGPQNYTAKAVLVTRKGTNIAELEKAAPKGSKNYRASRDQYTSHSEPTIAMDPLDHNHLMAGSKMYENNAKYLFKVGTYESFDGGRTWKDLGHLPGYCELPGQCDPANEVTYRTTSDPTIDFDDEGNVYINVLDAPGGTNAFKGFNMTVHVKRPGQPWSGPTVVHDNRVNALTSELFLDDKNWIAVDNHTDVNGGPNEPRDGKIGTMYICWSFDGTGAVPLQQIVVMRSRDGGKTWGGITPGDNLPFPISQKTLISGIGCHIAIGPRGEVYATWYDNQLNALMQAKSNNRGALWSLAVPIAGHRGRQRPVRRRGVPQPLDPDERRRLAGQRLHRGRVAERPGPAAARQPPGGRAQDQVGRADGRRPHRPAVDEEGQQHRRQGLQGGRRRPRPDVGLGHRAVQVDQRRALVHRTRARQPGPAQRRRRPVPAVDGGDGVRPDQHLLLRSPQRSVELLHRHVAGALGGQRAHVHRPPRVGAHVGSGRSTRRRPSRASSSATTRVSSPTTRSRSRSGTTRSSTTCRRPTPSTRPTRRSSPRACRTVRSPRTTSARAASRRR